MRILESSSFILGTAFLLFFTTSCGNDPASLTKSVKSKSNKRKSDGESISHQTRDQSNSSNDLVEDADSDGSVDTVDEPVMAGGAFLTCTVDNNGEGSDIVVGCNLLTNGTKEPVKIPEEASVSAYLEGSPGGDVVLEPKDGPETSREFQWVFLIDKNLLGYTKKIRFETDIPIFDLPKKMVTEIGDDGVFLDQIRKLRVEVDKSDQVMNLAMEDEQRKMEVLVVATDEENDKRRDVDFKSFQRNLALRDRNEAEPGSAEYFNAQVRVNFWSSEREKAEKELMVLAEAQDVAEQDHLDAWSHLTASYAHNMELKAKLIYLQGSEEGIQYFELDEE